jgi:uncharacterized protein
MNPYNILLNHQNYAVIGISEDPQRYSYKIFKKLQEKGKTVYGVNPRLESFENNPVYASLEAIGSPIDIAVFVVNPKFGIDYLQHVKDLNIKHVWLQPGTIDDALLEKAKALDLQVTQSCVLAQYAQNEGK